MRRKQMVHQALAFTSRPWTTCEMSSAVLDSVGESWDEKPFQKHSLGIRIDVRVGQADLVVPPQAQGSMICFLATKHLFKDQSHWTFEMLSFWKKSLQQIQPATIEALFLLHADQVQSPFQLYLEAWPDGNSAALVASCSSPLTLELVHLQVGAHTGLPSFSSWEAARSLRLIISSSWAKSNHPWMHLHIVNDVADWRSIHLG